MYELLRKVIKVVVWIEFEKLRKTFVLQYGFILLCFILSIPIYIFMLVIFVTWQVFPRHGHCRIGNTWCDQHTVRGDWTFRYFYQIVSVHWINLQRYLIRSPPVCVKSAITRHDLPQISAAASVYYDPKRKADGSVSHDHFKGGCQSMEAMELNLNERTNQWER